MNKRVLFQQTNGEVGIIIPVNLSQDTDISDLVPSGCKYLIIDADNVPADKIFRSAWEINFSDPSTPVIINFEKAKKIAHEIRQITRDIEFEPYDRIIMLQIPGDSSNNAEIERAKIRLKYKKYQDMIDTSLSVNDLTEILKLMCP